MAEQENQVQTGPPKRPENRFVAKLVVNREEKTRAILFGGTKRKMTVQDVRQRIPDMYLKTDQVQIIDVREATEAETGKAPAPPRIVGGEVVGSTPVASNA